MERWRGKNCNTCGVELTEENVIKYEAKGRRYVCRSCHRVKDREKKRRVRRRVLDVLGGKCVKCGFDDWRGLQIDHIKGDGYKERKRPISHNQSRYYEILKMDPEERSKKYQCLCANCNAIKMYENGEFRINLSYVQANPPQIL